MLRRCEYLLCSRDIARQSQLAVVELGLRQRYNSTHNSKTASSIDTPFQEAFLIETREHKMPYKHIAAQLKKTELACRLHYHQLSFGNKSRRHGNVSSSKHSYDRSSVTPPTRLRQQTPQLPLPSFSPPASPESHDYRSSKAAEHPSSHKPLLPKPVLSPQRSAQDTRQLRLVTDDVENFHERQYVDVARLDRIYEAHRLHFWSTIARSYGGNLSPSTLEDAWRRAHGIAGSNFPPTPRGSPQSAQPAPSILTTPYSAVVDSTKGFTPVNPNPPRSDSLPPNRAYSTSRSSFAISSLLTEDREVRRSPNQEKRLEDVELRIP